jgi:hypothetical protein
MLRTARFAPLLVLALLAGCSDGGKAAAEAAVEATAKSITPLKFEATRYAPKQLEKVEATLLKAREKLHDKDYAGATALAGEVGTMVKAMGSSIEQRKAALGKEYQDAAAEAGQQVAAVRLKIEELANAKKLPKGIDAAKVAAAQSELAAATMALANANTKMTEGSLGEAVAFLEQAKAKAAEIAKQLNP